MRIEQLTFTRFIAAIAIVVFHFGKEVFPFNTDNLSFIFRQANVGVSYFFVLSGFVMIIAYGQKDRISPGKFLKNRFARVYPVYFFSIIILLVYRLLSTVELDKTGFTLNVLLVQSWVPGKALSFNYPGWSLAVEFLFYLSFPVLFNKIYTKFSYQKLLLPVFLIWIATQIVFHIGLVSDFYEPVPGKSRDLLYYFPLMHINQFLVGNIVGLFFVNKLKNVKANVDWLIIMVIVILCILLKYNKSFDFHNGLLIIVFVPLIVLLSINKGFITKFSNKKVCIYLGEISFGIYILQCPVYRWILSAFSHFGIENPYLEFYVPLAVLILLSALSYNFIELPMRERIKNFQLARRKVKLQVSNT